MTGLRCRNIASPNHGKRRASVDMLVLHYTGMADAQGAIARLTDPRSEVSAHYLVDREGEVFALVSEDRRAWHAGQSSWHAQTDLNSRSIGVEIDHPGHDGGNPIFPAVQIEVVIALCRDVVSRLSIPAVRVLAHSDIAPLRKQDPGERFPWDRLHRAGIGHFVTPAPWSDGPSLAGGDGGPKVQELQASLSAYGYEIEATGFYGEETRSVVIAFQRHFRPERVDGIADPSTQATLQALRAALTPP
ncbi:MAG: N-acetylmuramoyl-L-alanine amidase [Hyphomicrobiales bacterium]|nr:N-acetylmuramoyl-L-alanine amidase [Hyphomicrobiales bacterium]